MVSDAEERGGHRSQPLPPAPIPLSLWTLANWVPNLAIFFKASTWSELSCCKSGPVLPAFARWRQNPTTSRSSTGWVLVPPFCVAWRQDSMLGVFWGSVCVALDCSSINSRSEPPTRTRWWNIMLSQAAAMLDVKWNAASLSLLASSLGVEPLPCKSMLDIWLPERDMGLSRK